MSEHDKSTQPKEDTKDLETTEQDELEEETDEETLGDTFKGEEPKEDKPRKGKPDTVPFDTFIELKKELQELKRGSSSNQSLPSDSSLDDLAKEYDVDPIFVSRLASAVKASATKDFEERYSSKIAEIESHSKRDSQDKKFDDLYSKSMEQLPHFDGIANKEVIKQLAFNPSNSKKTLSQLMEDVYGHAIQGKRTMETAQPNGGRDDETVDFSKAGDPATYARIKADPKLKKEYNEFLIKNLNL